MYGIHVNRFPHKNILDAINTANFKYVQIFLASPRLNRIMADSDKLEKDVKSGNLRDVSIIVHNNYTSKMWTDTTFVEAQLQRCKQINAYGLVIHLPAYMPNDNMSTMLNALSKYDTPIFLEIPATISKNSFYNTPQRIKYLFEYCNLDKNKFGICIDTAHLWTSGIDVSNEKVMSKWLQEYSTLSLKTIIHLNDSEQQLGNGPDSHAAFGTNIWSKSKKTLNMIIDFADANSIPIILERSRDGNYEPDIQYIRDYISK